MLGEKRIPEGCVTVVIRDDAPLVYCNSSPTYRTVSIQLTEEQRRAISLRCTAEGGRKPYFEQVSMLILEPDSTPEEAP